MKDITKKTLKKYMYYYSGCDAAPVFFLLLKVEFFSFLIQYNMYFDLGPTSEPLEPLLPPPPLQHHEHDEDEHDHHQDRRDGDHHLKTAATRHVV